MRLWTVLLLALLNQAFAAEARGDTFVLAEDDDELLEDTTPSMPTGGISRQLKPTQQPISDFSRRPQKASRNHAGNDQTHTADGDYI
ncbi:hypothetical protein E3U43_011745 [Larimichthys crocea]|uniref:Uncharacterized protein n=1 Tax=Larimichthys crocea TaxID=215358 RepID=A0ACD3QKS1_LARCR|nr:hypothetical protein E3U43_011745 [Larimichthys crocea]